MTVRERFDSFDKPGYYSRFNSTMVPELYLGLDDSGRKSIELREKFTPRRVSGTEAIDVRQYTKDEYNTVRFSLADEDVLVPFCIFCDDIVSQLQTVTDRAEAYSTVLGRFYQWKQMFMIRKDGLLSDAQIMGLIGEISFLKSYLADKIGLSSALKSWSGQELTHKDFSAGDDWYEIKTIGSGKPSVRISSLQQLESTTAGELVVYSLEKMSSTYNGISLNKLVFETRSLFTTAEERDDFLSRVSLQGYEYNPVYDDRVYEIVSCCHYKVSDNFPRLTRDNVPASITAATYDISLSDISDFLI